jgi:pimeloyl-ACP methyl ester carboxylesterase
MRQLLAELRRRPIYKFGAIYLALAWLLAQVAINIESPLRLPDWTDTFVIILLAIGFPVVLLLAWTHESKPTQEARTPGTAPGEVAVGPGKTGDRTRANTVRGDIRFCTTASGYRLAYSRVGQGSPVLKTGNWVSHLELEWDDLIFGPMLRDLSAAFELITYDGRGTGLSDREVSEFSLETMVEDMETVADVNRLDRFSIFAYSQSCAVAIAYAVRHPDRVARLVLYGGFAHNFRSPEEIDAIATLFLHNWGQDNAATRQIFTSALFPDATKEEFDSFNQLQMQSLSPESAARLFRSCHAIDVREEAKQVSAPTLVLHSRDEPGVPVECGREIASLIPDARFVSLNSRNHVLLEREPAYREWLNQTISFINEG